MALEAAAGFMAGFSVTLPPSARSLCRAKPGNAGARARRDHDSPVLSIGLEQLFGWVNIIVMLFTFCRLQSIMWPGGPTHQPSGERLRSRSQDGDYLAGCGSKFCVKARGQIG